MKTSHALLLTTLLFSFGCASSRVWVNPSKNETEAQKDFRECEYDSNKSSYTPYGEGRSPISAGIQEGFQSVTLMNDCMRSRGYHLADRQTLEEQRNSMNQSKSDLEEALKNKNNSRALEIINSHLSSNPNDKEAYVVRGNVYYLLDKPNEAIVDYNKASSMGSKNVSIVVGKATCFAEIGEYDVALEAVNQALASKPDAALYNIRAYVHNRKGDFDKALEDCNKSIAMDSSKPNAFKNRGLAYLGKADYPRAIEQFNKAIAILPDYELAYVGRGDAYLKLGKTDNAVSDFKKACELGNKDSCKKSGQRSTFSDTSEIPASNPKKEAVLLGQDNIVKPNKGDANVSEVSEPFKKEPILKTEAEVPSRLFFKEGTSFDHNAHKNFDCYKCHGNNPGKIMGFGKDYAHDNCRGCHKGNGGPTNCKECHK